MCEQKSQPTDETPKGVSGGFSWGCGTLMNQVESILQLLHGLGHIYAHHGQTKRALVLQLIASKLDPSNRMVLRSLAFTFLSDGAPDRALAVIARLRALKEDDPSLDLLQSKALWLAGQEIEARRVFRDFLERRRQLNHV
jgi:type III secretion protein Y